MSGQVDQRRRQRAAASQDQARDGATHKSSHPQDQIAREGLKMREARYLALIASDGAFGCRPSIWPWEARMEAKFVREGLVTSGPDNWLTITPAGRAALEGAKS